MLEKQSCIEFSSIFINLLIVVTLLSGLSEAITCKDSHGNNIDWSIVYKLPSEDSRKPVKFGRTGSTFGRTGFNYAYITSKHFAYRRWKLSSRTVKNETSIWAKTLEPLYAEPKKFTYFQWNDDPPSEKANSYYAHSKGVLALDENEGFWLTHSVPNFPPEFEKSYGYPESGQDNGQLSLCISFNTSSEAGKIGQHLLHIRPNIYAHNLLDGVPKDAESFKMLIDRKSRLPTISRQFNELKTPITTLNSVEMLAFGKDPRDLVDFYSHILSRHLECDLYVQTWRRGSGGLLETDCKTGHKIFNVDSMEMTFEKGHSSGPWKFTSDHSKWAISANDQDPDRSSGDFWVCIGDINRMKSQEKRGGGILCMNNPHVWLNFRNSIQYMEPCSKVDDTPQNPSETS